uniref:Putative secreted protein n=1 Tax=Ixodes ricinus TaxID=34613 RepID=A0A147BF36_IXORI
MEWLYRFHSGSLGWLGLASPLVGARVTIGDLEWVVIGVTEAIGGATLRASSVSCLCLRVLCLGMFWNKALKVCVACVIGGLCICRALGI